jgi:O-antigen ligase
MTGHSLIAPTENPRARRLYGAAVILLALLPVAMVIANRSSILFLVTSTLCALGGVAAERRTGEVVRDLRSALATPLGLAALAFLAWAALSVLWSGARPTTLHFLGEFWLPIGSALLLSLVLPQRLSRTGLWMIAGALVLGCAIILVELALGLDHRRAFGARAAGYIFNRSTVTILTLAIPVVAGLLVLKGGRERAGALVVFLSVAAVAAVTESGAGALGFLVALAAGAAAWVTPRWTAGLGAAGLLLVLASAPFLGPLAETRLPGSVHQALSGAHTRERAEIWSAFGAVVREEPVIGTGFATSARMPSLPVAARVEARHHPGLGMNHPHNAALQIWVELGVVGAALAAFVVLLTLQAVIRLPARALPMALALFATVAAISLVSHGAWQGWWAAAVGAAVVLARAVERLANEGPAATRDAHA